LLKLTTEVRGRLECRGYFLSNYWTECRCWTGTDSSTEKNF